jgi:hypothetical protein
VWVRKRQVESFGDRDGAKPSDGLGSVQIDRRGSELRVTVLGAREPIAPQCSCIYFTKFFDCCELYLAEAGRPRCFGRSNRGRSIAGLCGSHKTAPRTLDPTHAYGELFRFRRYKSVRTSTDR